MINFLTEWKKEHGGYDDTEEDDEVVHELPKMNVPEAGRPSQPVRRRTGAPKPKIRL